MGAELKNVACYSLVTMLYIEIHQGEEAIKKLGFQQDIGGTVVCMKILTRVKKV